MTRRTRAGFLSMALAATLTLSACGGNAGGEESPDQRTFATAIPAALGGFSPQDEGEGYTLQWMQAVYDTLIFARSDGSFTGMLAEEFTYNDDNTVLTLKLQEGVEFDDGTEFNAEAVKVNLLATRDGSGGVASNLSLLDDVEVIGDYEVALHLAAPDPSLVRSLSEVAGMIASPALVGTDTLETEPAGTGPYTLDDQRSEYGSKFYFTKKDEYWNDKLELPFDVITIESMFEDTARLNAMRSGQLDAAFVNIPFVEEAENSGLTITPYNTPGVPALYIWDREGDIVPALGDVRVRQAINYALDREAMLESIRKGKGEPTFQLFRPDSVAYMEDARYEYNPDEAKRLMAEAGYEDGFDLKMYKVAQQYPEADLIEGYLGEIGIRVSWEATTDPLTDMQRGDTGMSLFGFQSSSDWQLIDFFLLPNSPWNILDSSSDELNELIKTAQLSKSEDERAESIAGINEYLVEEAWFAPLYFLKGNYASRPGITVDPQTNYNVPFIYGFGQE